MAQDYDLPIVHHSNTWNPPYFPGYQDLWNSPFLGRSAAHPWGAMRAILAPRRADRHRTWVRSEDRNGLR